MLWWVFLCLEENTMGMSANTIQMCVGNGETCKRLTQSGVQSLPCPGPTLCEFGKGGLCKPYGRLNVKVGKDDDLGTFIFRTTGYNSIRTLAARLSYYQAVSGGLLTYMPLELKLRGKSTTQSHRTPIYYVDLVIRRGYHFTRRWPRQEKPSGW
ncbi:recombination directionality factor [Marinobacter pelagius]|uniref:recombination directionality factor n=1 Tax=Marinobacter pelagius TaxID=379482 RepID=UPI003CCBCF1C